MTPNAEHADHVRRATRNEDTVQLRQPTSPPAAGLGSLPYASAIGSERHDHKRPSPLRCRAHDGNQVPPKITPCDAVTSRTDAAWSWAGVCSLCISWLISRADEIFAPTNPNHIFLRQSVPNHQQ
jgi:hypothetical protein